MAARDRATVAAERVQIARRANDGGGDVFGGAFIATICVALGATALVFTQLWVYAAVVGIVAIVLAILAISIDARRRSARATVETAQRAADDASAQEREAAIHVAAVLEPLGVASVDGLARRRERAIELRSRRSEAERLATRAIETRDAARAAGEAFDVLARMLVDPTGARERDLAASKTIDARRITRDGIDLRLSMLEVRRTDVLGIDEEFALESELADLIASGVEAVPGNASPRAFEAERADIERRAQASRVALAEVAAELRTAEAAIGDLAELDERVAHLQLRAAKLETFESAVSLARETIDDRTREAHQKFAQRLADYASRTIERVTAGRYRDVRVDPTTLAVRVRVPETGTFVDVDRLSAGTREQTFLVTRLAMTRMFAEGTEIAPLLLDDPFAFWDDARIERCLPILVPDPATRDAQVVIFTTSEAFARAAATRGARTIDLSLQPEPGVRVGTLDGD